MIKIIELTKENEEQYLGQIAELEQTVIKAMEEEGREGQLFATGKEDISEYIRSEGKTVMVATDEQDQVKATTYITQGQRPFTYNDITKYFKCGDRYQEYVKSQYPSQEEYKKDLIAIYEIKIQAYRYAKGKIERERKVTLGVPLKQAFEKEVEENGFHEKSELREKLNEYMSEYIIENFGENIQTKYEQFYWCTSADIAREFGRDIQRLSDDFQEYDEIIEQSKLTIHESPQFSEQQYYTANTENAIELDTYITSPNNRSAGLARIIVFEGIKNHIERCFKNPNNQDVFLCSTLHRDNLSSKYVSEFFGLTDSLYVKRRQGRDREVHICRIEREQAMDYIASISNKLAVLYGYNPTGKHISDKTAIRVLKEQLEYEHKEYNRLQTARTTDRNFKGINVKFIGSKLEKVERLRQQIKQLNAKRREEIGEQ
ncbi:MAG: hypothetical protein HFJ55_06565 [Clostridia bacterium]|nr:hypothetical protein [Clostridia bacterium]